MQSSQRLLQSGTAGAQAQHHTRGRQARRRAVWRQTVETPNGCAPPGTEICDNPKVLNGWGRRCRAWGLRLLQRRNPQNRDLAYNQPGRRTWRIKLGARRKPWQPCGPRRWGAALQARRYVAGGQGSRLWTDAQSRELNLYLIVRPESSRFGQARLLSDDRSTEAKPGTDCAPARQYR